MSKTVLTLQPLAKAVGIALIGFAGVAAAHQVSLDGDIEVGDGYVATGDGFAVKTGDGDCLQSGTYNADEAVDACLGIEPVVEAEPEPEPEPEEPAKTRTVASKTIDGSALFGFDSDELSDEGIAAIQEVIREVTQYQGVTEIEIIGHTDSTGSAEYNQALSERRAETVKNALGQAYPDVNIIELAETAPDIVLVSKGMGESSPIADNSTSEGRASNRRVEIKMKAKEVTFK